MNKHYSLSTIIITIFLFVFVFFIAPLSYFSYTNFQKTLNKNIENYLTQIQNITETLFEHEAFSLENKASELSNLVSNVSSQSLANLNFENDDFANDVDVLFIKNSSGVINLSTALFDTDAIIQHIINPKRNRKNCIQNLVIDKENISVLLKSKKIINKRSGKVEGEVFVGKILNENLTFLNNIIHKSDLMALSFYRNKEIIATSIKNNANELNIVKNIDALLHTEMIYEDHNTIFAKIPLLCEDLDTGIHIIAMTESKVFKSLKEDYRQQILILIFFFSILGIITFILMRKFIVSPMKALLNFANNLKESDIEHPQSMIKEYNILGKGLENIISELREVKEQYTLAVEGTQEGLWDWNIKEGTIFFSERCKEMIGFGPEDELLTLTQWSDRIHKHDKEAIDKRLLSHLKQEIDVLEDEFRIECKDGTYKWLEIKAKALFDENNKAYRMVGFYSDIDKLKQLEKENKEKESYIIEQSKISAMGDMLSNISHQWRQPLSVITTIVSSMKVQLELGMFNKEDAHKDLDMIGKTAQNLSKTIDSFKDTYELEHKKEEFNLNEVILKDIKILEPAYTYHNISFVTNTKNMNYFGYKDELLLVLNKMIQNSKEAILNQKMEEGFIFIDLNEDKENIELTIYDNAKGIDESIKDKIFEPYFTTKHQAQGVGLSLYVTKNILTKYFDASIVCNNIIFTHENELCSGAQFSIRFPKRFEEKS